MVNGVRAMVFDRVWWLGFVSGLLLFSGICLVAVFQVRHLLATSVPTASTDGVAPKLGRWRTAMLLVLLVIKTFGAGAAVYWVLLVCRLPLLAFAAGLVAGLGVLVSVSVLGPRFRPQKKKKND